MMNKSHALPVSEQTLLASTKIEGDARINALPKHFPQSFLVVENVVYSFAKKLCSAYSGARWEFYEISNGGFFMTPALSAKLDVEVPFGNGYEGKMSADAFGVTVCLFAYSYMSEMHPISDFAEYYWRLRDFAGNHAEAAAIFSAID